MKVIATYKSWAEVEGVAGVVAGDVCIEHLFASIRVSWSMRLAKVDTLRRCTSQAGQSLF